MENVDMVLWAEKLPLENELQEELELKSANVFGMNAKEQDETHCCNVQGFCKIL